MFKWILNRDTRLQMKKKYDDESTTIDSQPQCEHRMRGVHAFVADQEATYHALCINPWENKANLRDLTAATGLMTLPKSDPNRPFSGPVTLKCDGWHKKQGTFPMPPLCYFISVNIRTRSNQSLIFRVFFTQCDLEFWRITLKHPMASHLSYFKLLASLQSHR